MPEQPRITHLGTTVGEWPVYTFTSEEQAAHWAADEHVPARDRYVWPIQQMVLGAPRRARKVPATAVLEPLLDDAAEVEP